MADERTRLARLRQDHREQTGADDEPDTAAVQGWFLRQWPPDQEAEAVACWVDTLAGAHDDLADLGPVQVQDVRRWSAQAATAIEVLRGDPREVVARASLGEALRRWAALLTSADRLDVLRTAYLTPSDPPLPIRTERLCLRGFRAEDTDDLHLAYGDPIVAEHLLTPPLTPGQTGRTVRERVARTAPKRPDDVLSLVVEAEGHAVGDLMLRVYGDGMTAGEIGWVLAASAAGRGYATEAARALLDLAFGHFGLHRVYAELDARNTRSAALCERLGMRREAHHLADYWSKGEFTGTLVYALLAEEWTGATPP